MALGYSAPRRERECMLHLRPLPCIDCRGPKDEPVAVVTEMPKPIVGKVERVLSIDCAELPDVVYVNGYRYVPERP